MSEPEGTIAAPEETRAKKLPKKKPSGRAVQIVSLSDNNRKKRDSRDLKLDTQVLWDIIAKAEHHPIAVIAIAGPARCGKSLMSNYIVKYLQALENSESGDAGDWMCKSNPNKKLDDAGFLFRSGMNRTTEGIWMWSRPFIIKGSQSDSPVAVIVMDTEGCFDPYSTEQEQSSIIGMSLLLSSGFIYNDLGRINENTFTTFAKFMQYGQLASQIFDGKIFQRLMFLIRDWTYQEFEHGASGGQGFIRQRLAADSKMSQEAVKNRQLIKDNFENYNAYLMPYPGPGVVSDEFTGSIGEMNEDFRDHMEKFIKHLIADIEPKRFGNQLAYAEPFRETFCKFVSAFNEDSMPSPASILAVTVYTSMNTQVQKLIAEYEADFRSKLESKNSYFHTPKALMRYNRKFRESSIEKFQSRHRQGYTLIHQSFTEKLEHCLNKKFSEICNRNAEEQQKFIHSRQQSCITKFQSFIKETIMTGTKIWSQIEYDNAVSPAKEETREEFKSQLNNIPKEFVENQVSLFMCELDKIQLSSWSVLHEKTAKAEEEAEEIVNDALSSYILSLDFIFQGMDSLSLSKLETVNDKHTEKFVLEGTKKLSKRFTDPDFVQKYTTNLQNSIRKEYEKRHTYIKGIEDIVSTVEGDLKDIVEVFKDEVLSKFASNPLLNDASILDIFDEILKVGEDKIRERGLPDAALTTRYINELNANMKSTLEEMRKSKRESQVYKNAECEKAFSNVSKSFSQALAVPPYELMEFRKFKHGLQKSFKISDQIMRAHFVV